MRYMVVSTIFCFIPNSIILVCDSMCHDDLENQVDHVDDLASKLLHAIFSHFTSSPSRLPALCLSQSSNTNHILQQAPPGAREHSRPPLARASLARLSSTLQRSRVRNSGRLSARSISEVERSLGRREEEVR